MQTQKAILVKTKRKIFALHSGNHPSIFESRGIDFREIKEYTFGDEIRKINWKVTAREQSPYVNRFNEERALNVLVVFLVSGSIYFGTQKLKQESMAEVLSALSFATLHQSDYLSTLFFSDKEEFFHAPTKNMGSLERLLDVALTLNPLSKTVDYTALNTYVMNRIKRKSLMFVIGDFYGDVDLSALMARNEVYAIMVRDHFEESPKLQGEHTLIDPNTMHQSSFSLSGSQLKAYAKKMEEQDARTIAHFKKHKIKHTKLYTDEEPYEKLFELFRG
ncbi:DUF58 domain-containing protein [Sulfurospirillum diekertiae]|uniref:DUF58 domain-containing protein n=1 Tax=Sulfurospirillum diekertiae TaxID=1854492 RepID=A0A858KCN1_9BACT|nr:DUF58 domain-containing protein [Sulfurospirillum diekertiae]QIR75684.2 DUF58 domain-containing protein [Sulfurospirillum diekertiae]QIR78331.2 DUF58 domain-containing protein [Sulfurospirillum diekertiae]